MIYIIDFDGTIVDVWERYFRILVDFYKVDFLTIENYKKLKMQNPNDRDLLKKLEIDHSMDEYFIFKHNALESEKYLKLDKLIVNLDVFNEFCIYNNVKILSIRNDIVKLKNQIVNLGLKIDLENIIGLAPQGIETKKRYIEENFNGRTIKIVGDSEFDMVVGQLKNVETIFVRSGLRAEIFGNFKIIKTYNDINSFLQQERYTGDIIIKSKVTEQKY